MSGLVFQTELQGAFFIGSVKLLVFVQEPDLLTVNRTS